MAFFHFQEVKCEMYTFKLTRHSGFFFEIKNKKGMNTIWKDLAFVGLIHGALSFT